MSLHSDILFRFRANQSFLLPLNVTFLTDRQQIPKYHMFVFGLTPQELEPTREETLHRLYIRCIRRDYLPCVEITKPMIPSG